MVEEMDLDGIIIRGRRSFSSMSSPIQRCGQPASQRYLESELLDRGIDVYTAVNIQHIESLNDVVARSPMCGARNGSDSVLIALMRSSSSTSHPTI